MAPALFRTSPVAEVAFQKQMASEIPELIETLLPSTSKHVRLEAKERAIPSDKTDEAFENRAWLLAYRLRPTFITTARDPG